MTNDKYSTTNSVKIMQYRNLIIAMLMVCIAIISGIYFISDDSDADIKKRKEKDTPFVSPLHQISAETIWRERAQNKLKEQEKRTLELNKELKQLKTENASKSLDADPRYQDLKKQIDDLKSIIKGSTKAVKPGEENNAYSGRIFPASAGPNINDGRIANHSAGIDNDVISLTSKNDLPAKNPDSFVSSGTFAKAIMLGAADASAGVKSQANPTPMLFRIIADGTLPNSKKSHLKGCVVTAAVVGDISSERGQIRLERISCTFPNKEIVEQQVEGTIFGMDAKNGVRGKPVWREGALLGRAAVAGTLSGLGSAVSQSYTTSSISPLGSTQTVNGGNMLRYGAAQGASNAMEKLADYNISRAEQYHPIIQLTAGQPVDIVFLKGFFLDGRKHAEDSGENTTNSASQLFSSSHLNATSGLTLTASELQKIKDHEKGLGW